MKKIINDPSNILDEMLNGLVFAYEDLVERLPETSVIHRKGEKLEKLD